MAASNLALRVLTAVVALPLVGALIMWREQPLGFGLLVVVVAALALTEYVNMTLASASRRLRFEVIAVGVALEVGLYLRPELALVWLLGALILASAAVLLEPGEIPAAGARLGLAGFGVVYLGAMPASLAILHRDAVNGAVWVCAAIAVTFANDTGAYFAGRTMGRHKLYPVISPGKTVEGAVGGLVAGVGVLLAGHATLTPAITLADCILIGGPAAVLGPIGDLVESMIKRSVGAKDSGKLLPGHGGMLDRIDALLFVSAWTYVYVLHLR
jgi:phosphatidate cytidylyltransferase